MTLPRYREVLEAARERRDMIAMLPTSAIGVPGMVSILQKHEERAVATLERHRPTASEYADVTLCSQCRVGWPCPETVHLLAEYRPREGGIAP